MRAYFSIFRMRLKMETPAAVPSGSFNKSPPISRCPKYRNSSRLLQTAADKLIIPRDLFLSRRSDMVEEIRVGDVVMMKKQHPCGSSTWTVTRTGTDIKMRCEGCGRVVMLDRDTFLKRRKRLLEQGPEPKPLDMSYYAP